MIIWGINEEYKRFPFYITGPYLSIITVFIFFHLYMHREAWAKVTGRCDNCHTMHNSQNGSAIIPYGADGMPWKEEGPHEALTRGTCLGCHGMGTSNRIETIDGCEIPQVYHTDPNDLAGGNFAYILGAKGTGASDAKGHNVVDIGNPEDTIIGDPPGFVHAAKGVTSANLTCSGRTGCHGFPDPNYGLGMEGAHHQNVDGKCNIANEVYNSYRFLLNVKGFENPIDKWQNRNSDSHNEYYGKTSPPYDYNSYCTLCHREIASPSTDLSISYFCGTCHGNFHGLNGYDDDPGIGGDTISPFLRHPTDIRIRNEGEYAVDKRTFDARAPVGRTTVPDSIISGATENDVVTCLSCHVAHASDYPDLLRWDYSTVIAGGGGSGACFTCHTEKDNI